MRERELLEEPHSVYRVLIVDDHGRFRRCAPATAAPRPEPGREELAVEQAA